jgi:peroxiredoxin
MKIWMLAIVALLQFTAFAQFAPQPFEITGDVSKVKQKMVKVHYRYQLNGKSIDDSAIVKDNRYVLKGMTDEHVMLASDAVYADTSIEYDYRRDYQVIHIVPGTRATAKHGEVFAQSEIKGSAAQDEYNLLHERLVKGETDFVMDYIRQHPGSPLGIFLLTRFVMGPFVDPVRHEPLYNVLSDQIKNTPSGKLLGRRIAIAKRLAAGNPAPDVSQQDSAGNIIKLSGFKGKYVLLEFWASWCAPCRRENPMLVTMYNKYRSKGFEIFGISVDENRKSWISAMKKDGLTWTNTANMQNTENNPAALTYGVTAIPFNVLVDKDGKIIETNVRGKRLEERLMEVFGE